MENGKLRSFIFHFPFFRFPLMNYFNYFSEIEQLFIRRRGRNLLLSPLDWALIENWQERQVPLHIILRAIERIFDTVDKQSSRKRTVKSLLYCKEEIEAQFAEWQQRQVGAGQVQGSRFKVQGSKSGDENSVEKSAENSAAKSNLFPNEAIAAHLERVSAELNHAKDKVDDYQRGVLEKVQARLSKLRAEKPGAEALEETLEKLDALIDASLLQTGEDEKLRAEIEREIASYKTKMEREVYERTFELMLLKRLREKAEIPRISLFYL